MKSVLNTSLAAIALAAVAAGGIAAPVQAQVAGIATSSPEAAILQAQARINAYNQISEANASAITQIGTVRNEINTLQQGLDTNGDRNVTQAEVDAQPALWEQYQAKEQQLEQISSPILLAQYYVIEQLLERYGQAQNQVIQSQNIQIMLTPEAFQYAAEAVNVTDEILAALNQLVPSVTITPPANYQPRRDVVAMHQTLQQLLFAAAARQQQAAQGAQQQPAAEQQQQPSGR